MKNIKFLSIFLTAFFIFAQEGKQKSLADLYRTGNIRLIPKLTIDDSSMPEGIFFQSLLKLASDDKGYIYISDYQANNIKKFDSSGKFIKIIGRQGQGPGDFNRPLLMTFAKDRLVVWDMGNRRICALAPDGEFIKSVEIPAMEGWPRRLRPLPNGDIVMEREKIHFRETNKPQDCTIELFSPELENKMTIYSKNIWRRKYVAKGGGRYVPQPFSPQVCWDVSPDGKIIIGFSEEYKIEIYDSKGEKVSSFSHSYEPVKVTEEDKKGFFSGVGSSRAVRGQVVERKQGADDFLIKNTVFPKFKPTFYNILVDSEGNILITTFRKDKAGAYRYFDAFDPKGNFIQKVHVVGDVLFPGNQRICFVNNSCWIIEKDENDLAKIRKYNISE